MTTPSQSLIGRSALQYGYGGLRLGGGPAGLTVNRRTGAGTVRDSNIYTEFGPAVIESRYYYNNARDSSWAVQRVINMPIDDQFTHWRQFDGSTAENMAMKQAEKDHNIRYHLREVQRAARLYGGAALILKTGEAPLSSPLNVNRLRRDRPGRMSDLRNLILIDRYDLTPIEWHTSFNSPNYNMPSRFRAYLRGAMGYREIEVDASRVLTFQGDKPPVQTTDSDWEFWGKSILTSVLRTILQQATVAQALAHLVNEASIPVYKQHRFAKALAQEGRETDSDYPSIMKRLEANTEIQTVWGAKVLDKNDDFERVQVTFSALPEIFDKFAEQVAEAAGLPVTQFLGREPTGMNATGESNREHYAAFLKSMQERMLDTPLLTLDRVLARVTGLTDPPAYHWLPAFSLSEQEQVLVSERKGRVVKDLFKERLIDGRTARDIMTGDGVFGDLPEEMAGLPNVWESQQERMPRQPQASGAM